MARRKKLTPKQMKAIELLTSGKGLKYKDICAEVEIDQKTLWSWQNAPEFSLFQEELKKVEEEKWNCLVDAAKAAAMRLLENDNPKIVEYVLKTAGYNPVQEIKADISTDITINIEE